MADEVIFQPSKFSVAITFIFLVIDMICLVMNPDCLSEGEIETGEIVFSK